MSLHRNFTQHIPRIVSAFQSIWRTDERVRGMTTIIALGFSINPYIVLRHVEHTGASAASVFRDLRRHTDAMEYLSERRCGRPVLGIHVTTCV